jgi:hypothetical protein
MNTSTLMRIPAVVAGLLAVLSAYQANAAAIVGIDPKTTITATMDGGVAKTGNTWYELGVNGASNTTGLATGIINSGTDPLSTYLIQPATGNNALMLDSTHQTGTLTFGRPLSLTALSLAGASGNGTGTNVLTLHFSDGSSDTLPPVNVGDWFNNNPRAATAHGRIDVGANSFNNVGADNPRILAINETLSAADAAKFITSIDLSFSGGGANTHTAIFGVSGDFTGLGHFQAIPLADGSFNQDMIVGLKEVPEPGTLALFGLGVLGLLGYCRRKHA